VILTPTAAPVILPPAGFEPFGVGGTLNATC